MYLLDANIFIQSHKEHYNMNVFPCFWAKLVDLARQGVVYTLDKVEQEVMVVGDSVAAWLRNHFPPENILALDDSTYAAYQKVMDDVNALGRYSLPALAGFANPDIADPFLCAYAMSHIDCSVVTYEKSDKNRIKKVMLPDVCELERVPCSDVIPMLLSLGVRF